MGKITRGIRCLLQALVLVLVLIGLSPILLLAGVSAFVVAKANAEEIKEETIWDYM